MEKFEQQVNRDSSIVEESPKFNQSGDENSYRKFAAEMASSVVMNNKSESVDVLINTLKNSKYYAGL